MDILRHIAENLRGGPVTLRFPERVEPPEGFRGLVELDAQRCVGCATCAYVCPSQAIVVTHFAAAYEWAYDAGRCTFCGRCADVCPSQALSMQRERPPVYVERDTLRQVYMLDYPRCAECGQPAPPVNEIVLQRAFPEVSDEIRAWSRLCTRCRQRRYHPPLIETGYAGRSRQYGR
jgi:ferredoxin